MRTFRLIYALNYGRLVLIRKADIGYENVDTGMCVALRDARETVFAAHSIMFSVKAQRDQTIAQLHALISRAVTFEDSADGQLVDLMSGTLANLVQRVIMALDIGERTGDADNDSYGDCHVTFMKRCSQILKILSTPIGPFARANGIVTKPAPV